MAQTMTYALRVLSLIVVLFWGEHVTGQISPGELTKAHANLEGISNCTKCHTLGDKVSNDKCLACHTELRDRVQQQKGYHASAEVSGKDCFSCHSEHHGRNFEILRFNELAFDHNKTGYRLTGAHLKQNCASCHQDDHIASADLRKKEKTYLGLSTDCVSCHTDVHQKTLPTDCASCHNTDGFSPAVFFNHDKAAFPLKGKHQELECKSCHQVTYTNGALFQKFKGVPFGECSSCHTDPHDGAFGTTCSDCHAEQTFLSLKGRPDFNHSLTRFPLIGKHKNLDCASCHQMEKGVAANQKFKDYSTKDFHQCITCHQDVHGGKFGTDCKACHSEDSFRKLKNEAAFNHALTAFPLEGKHQLVDCRKCHESTRMTDPVAHQQCLDCHNDFHHGQFTKENKTIDCRQCHTVDDFASSTFSLEEHDKTKFPLTGAHLATPCFACHLREEKWTFRKIGTTCSDCHTDIHNGGLSEKYYPDKSCTSCHTPDAWTAVGFEHEKTGFALTGKHEQVSCTGCHQPDPPSAGTKHLFFSGKEMACNSCHDNIHGDQFAKEGITKCEECHSPEHWKPSRFDHHTARFVPDGAHAKLDCIKCHMPEGQAEGERIIYRNNKTQCIDCHS